MYIKNSNFVIYLVAAAIVGFGASFLFAAADFQNGLGSGDISKASRYNNVKEDPDVAVIVEKLQNDTAFFNQSKASIEFLRERVSSLAALSEETAKLCGDIPALNSNVSAMNSLSVKAHNTSIAFESVSDELERIADGKESPAYEQTTNNAYIGFQKVENQLDAAKAFVESANDYLSDKDIEKNEELAGMVALWSVYCAQDAAMMEDKDNMKYWNGKLNFDAATTQAFQNTVTSFDGKFLLSLAPSQVVNGVGGMQNFNAANNLRVDNNMHMMTAPTKKYGDFQGMIPGIVNGYNKLQGLRNPDNTAPLSLNSPTTTAAGQIFH